MESAYTMDHPRLWVCDLVRSLSLLLETCSSRQGKGSKICPERTFALPPPAALADEPGGQGEAGVAAKLTTAPKEYCSFASPL